jgi:hypothetical protein
MCSTQSRILSNEYSLSVALFDQAAKGTGPDRTLIELVSFRYSKTG